MSSLTHTDGIQQLLMAEKQAAVKVSDARKRKAKRLKQAKDEAISEIQKFKNEKEIEFKEHEEMMMGSKTESEASIQQDTDSQIKELESAVQANMEKALEIILSHICEINAKLHVNFSGPNKQSEEVAVTSE